MDTLVGVRAFVSVADAESFTKAATRLGLTTQLVSKYVRQLEARLGVQLLNRTTRSVTLTDTGRLYLSRCRNLIEQFDEMDSLVREQQGGLSGRIRLTAPTGYGQMMVTPALADFQALHPDIEFDFNLTDRRVSIVEEGYDFAVRIGQAQDSSLTMRKLIDMPILVCASPAYLEERGEPQHPLALSTHECLINNDLIDPGIWRFQEDGEPLSVKVSGRFSVNQPRALADLACLGRGIAALPAYVIAKDIRQGRLRALLSEFSAPASSVYALYPSRRYLTRRVKALLDFLSDRAKAGL